MRYYTAIIPNIIYDFCYVQKLFYVPDVNPYEDISIRLEKPFGDPMSLNLVWHSTALGLCF